MGNNTTVGEMPVYIVIFASVAALSEQSVGHHHREAVGAVARLLSVLLSRR
jgi:hypothetical protein